MLDFAFAIALRASSVTGSGLGMQAPGAYVSPSGTGTACSQQAPCSLATGLALHQSIIEAPGTYRLASPIALTSLDSGHSLTCSTPGACVNIGSVQPGTWSVSSGSIQKASVAAGASNRQLWVQASGSTFWSRKTRAQASGASLGTWTANGTGFAGASTLGGLADKLDLELVGPIQFLHMRCPVSAVTNSQLTAVTRCWGLATGGNAGSVSLTALGSVENSLGLLTQSGMFYLDGAAGYNGTANELYYQPDTTDGTLSAADVEVPVLSQLVTLNGASNFTIAGIVFEFSSWQPQAGDGVTELQGDYYYQTVASTAPYLWPYTAGGASMAAQVPTAAITATNSPGLTLSGNTFAHIGGAAVSVQGTTTGTVTTNSFYDLSGSAVIVGSSMAVADQTTGVSNVTVTNNKIALVGQDYWTAPAIELGYVSGVVVTHNDIEFSNYDGIMTGGFSQPGTFPSYGQNVVSNNRVYDAMHRQLQDGGGVYFTGNQATGLSSVASGNVVDGTFEGPQANIYLDTRTSFMTLLNNVVIVAGGTCLLYIQTTPSIGFSNTASGWFSNVSTACNSFDSSNSFATPTIIATIYDSAAAAVLAASGSTLRGIDIAHGASVTVSGGTTASQLTDTQAATFGNGWVCNATPCTATVNLGSSQAIHEIDVVNNVGNNTPSQGAGYTVATSPDNVTYTTWATVPATGSFQSYFYSGEEVFYSSATAQYVKLTSSTNVLAFSEIKVE